MAIDPGTTTYATADLLRAAAVQDVDINTPGPNGETSGKALVVVTAGSTASSTVEGDGSAGTPAGGVLTVQGDPAGTPIPVIDSQSALVAEAMGSITDTPWDGVAAGATVISLLKKIALNTTPAP